MAELRLENYFLAFIVFTLIVLGGVGVITNINNNYNVSMGQGSEFNTTIARANQVYNSTVTTSSSMKTSVADADISEDTTENSMFKGAFSAVRNSMGIFGIMGGLINDIGGALGIPAVFTSLAIAAFLIILAFALVYLIFRFKPWGKNEL